MPRPISGETHTYRVNVKQRSGVYYVYERTERYENGRMRKVGKDVLIGKILPMIQSIKSFQHVPRRNQHEKSPMQ